MRRLSPRWWCAAALVLLAAAPAIADSYFTQTELRPFVGSFVPTGPERDALRGMPAAGVQGAYQVMDAVHFVATVAMAPGRYAVEPHRRVNLFLADAGVELFDRVKLGDQLEFRPFLALGAGGRAYDPLEVGDTKTRFSGYGGVGGEFQKDPFALRLEGRDYVTRGDWGPDNSALRNDLLITAALAIHW